jgi:hypothetical protein
MKHDEINQGILNRELFSGQEEGTYFNQELYNFFCDNYDDPHLLFKIKIKGYYQKLYKWTDLETEQFIEDHKDIKEIFIYIHDKLFSFSIRNNK